MKKKRKLRFDKVLILINSLLVVAIVFSISFSQAWLSKVNIELESTRKKVTAQEKVNESLSMKINELASIDNIGSVAETNGLEYNNSNIINLSNKG